MNSISYSKKQLQADIAEQGGIPTTEQETLLAMFEVESLKNTISYRCISDHYKGTNKLLYMTIKIY